MVEIENRKGRYLPTCRFGYGALTFNDYAHSGGIDEQREELRRDRRLVVFGTHRQHQLLDDVPVAVTQHRIIHMALLD